MQFQKYETFPQKRLQTSPLEDEPQIIPMTREESQSVMSNLAAEERQKAREAQKARRGRIAEMFLNISRGKYLSERGYQEKPLKNQYEYEPHNAPDTYNERLSTEEAWQKTLPQMQDHAHRQFRGVEIPQGLRIKLDQEAFPKIKKGAKNELFHAQPASKEGLPLTFAQFVESYATAIKRKDYNLPPLPITIGFHDHELTKEEALMRYMSDNIIRAPNIASRLTKDLMNGQMTFWGLSSEESAKINADAKKIREKTAWLRKVTPQEKADEMENLLDQHEKIIKAGAEKAWKEKGLYVVERLKRLSKNTDFLHDWREISAFQKDVHMALEEAWDIHHSINIRHGVMEKPKQRLN